MSLDNSVDIDMYRQDNIVTIFVPGDGECEGAGAGAGAEGGPALAIVASNTLRLRIVPCSGAGDSSGHAAAITTSRHVRGV